MITNEEIKKHVEAMDFASAAHAAQMYGEVSYVRHLAHVESVLHRFNFQDADLLTAAWLHDCIEDAGVSWREIDTRFGEHIAALVFAVTNGEGANRRERQAASYAKMRDFRRAIILKLADRIANVESSMIGNGELLKMYRKEYPSFREKLYAASLERVATQARVAAMWSYLDRMIGVASTQSDSQ